MTDHEIDDLLKKLDFPIPSQLNLVSKRILERKMQDASKAIKYLRAQLARSNDQVSDFNEWSADVRRLVKELDEAMHGDQAAAQASLCDLVPAARSLRAKAANAEPKLGPIEQEFYRLFGRRIDAGGIFLCTGGKKRCEDCRCGLPTDWRKRDANPPA